MVREYVRGEEYIFWKLKIPPTLWCQNTPPPHVLSDHLLTNIFIRIFFCKNHKAHNFENQIRKLSTHNEKWNDNKKEGKLFYANNLRGSSFPEFISLFFIACVIKIPQRFHEGKNSSEAVPGAVSILLRAVEQTAERTLGAWQVACFRKVLGEKMDGGLSRVAFQAKQALQHQVRWQSSACTGVHNEHMENPKVRDWS